MSQIFFDDVTAAAGLSLSLVGTYGQSWGDYNGDGLPDIWVNNHLSGKPILYKNQGNGTFANVTSQVFLSDELGGDDHGAPFADFDNDGDQDLLQTAGAEGASDASPTKVRFWYNSLYINDAGVYRDKALSLGIDEPLRREQDALWFDFNNDGLLDIFLGALPRDNNEFPPTILLQTPTGFVDGRAATGFNLSFAPYAFLSDLTGDRKLDFIVKSRSPSPALNIYDAATLPLVDVTAQLVKNISFQDLAIADFNGDLKPDIFVTQTTDFLLENTDKGLVKRTDTVGLSTVPTYGTSAVAADFDNDMDVDVFVVTSPSVGNTPDILYENLGNGTFAQVANAGGAVGTNVGRGDSVVAADYDLNGFVDLFVTNGKDEKDGPYQLFRNRGNGNNWLEIDLQGVVSNRDGIGASVLIRSGGFSQLREQGGGFHKWSQDSKRIHFGLAQNKTVDLIEIHWPSGAVQQLQNVAANQVLRVVEANSSSLIPFPGNSPIQRPLNKIRGTRKTDRLTGTAGRDKISGLKRDDVISGKDDDDVLRGNVGNDVLRGDNGNDKLNGGSGRDYLNGGEGDDIYMLGRKKGRDVIGEFEKGDQIDLPGKLKFKDLTVEKVKNGSLLSIGKDELAIVIGAKPSIFAADVIL